MDAQQHFQSLTNPSTATSTVPPLGRTVKKGQIISDASHVKLAIGERTSPTHVPVFFFFFFRSPEALNPQRWAGQCRSLGLTAACGVRDLRSIPAGGN